MIFLLWAYIKGFYILISIFIELENKLIQIISTLTKNDNYNIKLIPVGAYKK